MSATSATTAQPMSATSTTTAQPMSATSATSAQPMSAASATTAQPMSATSATVAQPVSATSASIDQPMSSMTSIGSSTTTTASGSPSSSAGMINAGRPTSEQAAMGGLSGVVADVMMNTGRRLLQVDVSSPFNTHQLTQGVIVEISLIQMSLGSHMLTCSSMQAEQCGRWTHGRIPLTCSFGGRT